MEKLLFPQLKGKWKSNILLNKYAKLVREDVTGSPWHGKQVFGKWIDVLHETFEVDYSWGGYLENREDMLEGTYLPSGGRIHLGLDFWVPEETEVHLPKDGTLLRVSHDLDQDGGWGGQIFFEIDGIYYIFGHLGDISTYTIGKKYSANTRIAEIAGYDKNGGWYPHLHVQCMKKLDYDIDGYSYPLKTLSADYPHPMRCLGLI